MAKYYSEYLGEDIDEAVTWVKNYKRTSTARIIESSLDNKIDLNTLITEEGLFTIAYYTNSMDDTSTKTINIEIVFVNKNLVLQRYDLNGLTAQRTYYRNTRGFTAWNYVKTFILANEDEQLRVGTDTLVFRIINDPADEWYNGDNVGEPGYVKPVDPNPDDDYPIPDDDSKFWGYCAHAMGSYFVPLDQYYGANQAILATLAEIDEEKVNRDEIPDWVYEATEMPNFETHVTKESIGLDQIDNTSDLDKPVSVAQKAYTDQSLAAAKAFAIDKINELIGGAAPETLDTITKLAEAIGENGDILDVLNEAIGNKEDKNTVNAHLTDINSHVSESDRLKINAVPTKVDKSDINGFKIYTSISQLIPGKETLNEVNTLTEIINAMPNNSMFCGSTNTEDNTNGIAPTSSGTLQIMKYSDLKVTLLYWPTSSDGTGVFKNVSMALYNATTGITPWKKLLNEVNAKGVLFEHTEIDDDSMMYLSANKATGGIQSYDTTNQIAYRLQLGNLANNVPYLKVMKKAKNATSWEEYGNTNLVYAPTLDMINGIYEGVDLTQRFADEIVHYDTPWNWIHARINTGNFNGIFNKDYIPLVINGLTYRMQVNINTYKGVTTSQLGASSYLIGNHIDFISKELYPVATPWNRNKTNNGTASIQNPYLVSTVHEFLVDIANKIPEAVMSHISDKPAIMELRYSGAGTLTSSVSNAWVFLGKLWLPSEVEITGIGVCGTPDHSSTNFIQYPSFAGPLSNKILRHAENGNQLTFWTSTVANNSSERACAMSGNGSMAGSVVTNSSGYYVPICFRIQQNVVN